MKSRARTSADTCYPSVSRRLYQYTVRSLLLLMTVVAIALAPTFLKLRQRRLRRAFAETIVGSGGTLLGPRHEQFVPAVPGPTRDGRSFSEAWSDIVNDDPLVRTVRVSSRAKSIDGRLRNIAAFPEIREVSLQDTDLSDTGLGYLSECRGVNCLELSNTEVTDAGVEKLTKLTELRELYLAHTAVSDKCAEDIAKMSRLEVLVLSDTHFTELGLSRIAGLPALTQLSLNGTRVTGNALSRFAARSSIKYLELSRTDIDDRSLQHVIWMQNLEGLDLSSTGVTDKGLVALIGLVKLQSLDLSNTRIVGPGLERLVDLSRQQQQLDSFYECHLFRLILSHNAISDDCLRHVRRIAGVRTLDLSHTSITDAGVQYLCSMRSLREIDLRVTKVSNHEICELKKVVPRVSILVGDR